MEKTPDAILTFAAQLAQRAWDENREPYLLARLSPELEKEGVNYKEVLGEQRLKDFLLSAPERVKLVFHPTQKSKIGLIPMSEAFQYKEEPDNPEARPTSSVHSRDRDGSSRRRFIVANFLQLLSELDDVEAAQVQIPTQVLMKLMRDR